MANSTRTRAKTISAFTATNGGGKLSPPEACKRGLPLPVAIKHMAAFQIHAPAFLVTLKSNFLDTPPVNFLPIVLSANGRKYYKSLGNSIKVLCFNIKATVRPRKWHPAF